VAAALARAERSHLPEIVSFRQACVTSSRLLC
jgi:hypothetical protein